MPHFRSSRMVALGVALACGLTPSARAGGFFGCCSGGSCDTTVNLPPQRVVVETTAPRVAIQETTRVSRSVLPPMIGTVYMPMAFPVAGFGMGVGVGREAEVTTRDDCNPLRTAHEAEIHLLRHETARAALRAEIDAKNRVLNRMGTSSNTTTDCDLDKKINDLKDKIDKLSDRLSSVERLVLIHDNFLKEKLPPSSAPDPIKGPMIKP